MFRIYYDEKRIRLSIHHMLTDFLGADNFLKCILRLCFGLDPRGSLVIDPNDTRDPYVLYGDTDSSGYSMKNKWINELEIPSSISFRRGEACRVHHLSFPIADLLKCSKRAESSVFPLMSWLIAKAVARLYDAEDKMIVGSGAFNCRSLYNSKTPKCFSHAFPVVLHPRERNMDLDTQLTIQRTKMELEIESETVAVEVGARRKAASIRLENLSEYVRDQEALDIKRRSDSTKICFFNSYAGSLSSDDELSTYIEGAAYYGAVTRNPIVSTTWSWEDLFHCNIEETGCKESIAPIVLKIANEYGISGTIEDLGDFFFDTYPMEELFDD